MLSSKAISTKQLQKANSLQDQNQIISINFYGCLALLLNMCDPSCLGPHSLGFPSPSNIPPTCTALSLWMIFSSHTYIVDLVKLDLVHLHWSLFTHESVKSSFYLDPFPHHEGFYSDFYYAWSSLPIYPTTK